MLVLNIESSTYITRRVKSDIFTINIKHNRIIILAILYFYDLQNRESYNFQL